MLNAPPRILERLPIILSVIELIVPSRLPINPPIKFSIAHAGTLINLSIILPKKSPTILNKFLVILLNKQDNNSRVPSLATFTLSRSIGATS